MDPVEGCQHPSSDEFVIKGLLVPCMNSFKNLESIDRSGASVTMMGTKGIRTTPLYSWNLPVRILVGRDADAITISFPR